MAGACRFHLAHGRGGALMSPRPQPRAAHAAAAPYRSSACGIGTHDECAHSSPASAPVGVPVVYEACSCPCHPPIGKSPSRKVPR